MSGSIVPFSYIPPNLRVPLFYAEFSNVAAGVSQPVQRRLIIGQATTSVPATPTFVSSVSAAQQVFGARSQIAARIAAYRANDPFGELWALPLADAVSSVAATGTIAFTGAATASGTIAAYIAGTLVTQGVNVGDTAAVIATNLAATITSIAYATLPVTATAATGTVTLTAANKGTLGNSIPIVLNYLGAEGGQTTPAGITVTITPMASGATDPGLSAIATNLGVQGFDFIASPYSDLTSLGATSGMMSGWAGRWSYAQQLYGHVFSAHTDTIINLITYGASLNDQHLTVLAVNQASPTPPWLWDVALMAQFSVSSVIQPNRPVQSLVLNGVLPATAASEFSFGAQQSLLTEGLAVAVRGVAGVAQIVRAVTTYQLNSFGQPDQSYLDAETMFTLMAVVRTLKGAITQKFPRALLADDGTRIPPTPPGSPPVIVTPGIIKNELVAQYGAMVDAGLCMDESTFAAGLLVQRNVNDNSRVDVLYDPYLVSGLRIFAMLTQFHMQAAAAA